MKKIAYFTLAFLALSILACQDNKDEAKSSPDLDYFHNIGKQIPTQTGYRWIDVYRSRFKLAGRENPLGYSLSRESLEQLTSSVNTLLGVVIQHATDETGAHHFLLIPIDERLTVWSEDKIIIDANTDAVVSFEEARQWADTYQTANPGGIMYHLFGRHVFDEMKAIPFFEYIQIEPALNENLAPQVLLIVNDVTADISSGRSEYEESVVYDFSRPCEPYCSLEEN